MTRIDLIGFLTAVAALPLLGCSSDDSVGEICTTNYVNGLVVDVENGATAGECAYTVTATEGSYVETLRCEVYSGDTTCHCYGAGERAGSYLVEVTSESDVIASQNVTVLSDECHVQTEQLSFSAP
jgi:hypothetical protein